MKIEELRVGNIIKYKKGHISKVIGTYSNDKQIVEVVGVDGDYINGVYECDNFYGIEITDKILENLGFYLDYDGGYYRSYRKNDNDNCDRFNVHLDSAGCSYYISDFGAFKQMKYIHELQNLYFILTGCELQYVA